VTGRRAIDVLAVGVAGFVLGIAVTLGLQSLMAPGVALPTDAAAAGPSPAAWIVGLPRRDITPGAINPVATQATLATTVCMPGWAGSVRPPSAYTSALKIAQLFEYGYDDRNPTHYQEDHLVPLELGGAPRDPRNLWPQPNDITLADGTAIGSQEKDDLEDVLNAKVCSGEMALDKAQLAIARDWIKAWQDAGRP
jgi:hypothetical protein